MNDLGNATACLVMTSREIAALTRKRHTNVLRDIDKTIENLDSELSRGFKSTTYKDANGIERRQFELDRDSTFCVVAGYDDNSRMRIVKRWQELEAEVKKPMSPAEILIHQGQLLLAIEQEQKLLDERQTTTEKRLDQIETASDHFTVVGYYRYAHNNGSIPLQKTAQIGRLATQICNEHGVQMGSVPDPRFGTVKTYPKWVLESLFDEAGETV